jgi:hypothetical protein
MSAMGRKQTYAHDVWFAWKTDMMLLGLGGIGVAMRRKPARLAY